MKTYSFIFDFIGEFYYPALVAYGSEKFFDTAFFDLAELTENFVRNNKETYIFSVCKVGTLLTLYKQKHRIDNTMKNFIISIDNQKISVIDMTKEDVDKYNADFINYCRSCGIE